MPDPRRGIVREGRPSNGRHPSTASAPLPLRAVRGYLRALAAVAPGVAGREAFRLWFRTSRVPEPPHAARILAEAGQHALRVGRKRVVAYEWGEGPGIVLMHGWGGRAADMTHFVPALLARGHRVVAMDAPAHGRSSGRRTDIWEFADALAGLDRLAGPFDGAIAHSLGSLALASALEEKRLHVERAACLAPAVRMESMLQTFGATLHLPDPVLADVGRRLVSWTGEEFWRRAVIRAPTLILHDHDDRRIPISDSAEIGRTWPQARLIATQGLGHRGILRAPDVVRQAVEFVSRN